MGQWPALLAVAVAGGVLLAGCAATEGPTSSPSPDGDGAGADWPTEIVRFEMTPVNDTELTRAHTRVMDSGSKTEMRVLADIHTNGSAIHRGTRPLFDTGRPVLYDGTVYNVTHEVGERTPRMDYAVTLNPVDEGEGFRFEDLPAVDRRQFEDGNLTDGIPFGIGTQFEYTEAEVEQSVLVPEPEQSIIVWDSGDRAEIRIDWAQRDELVTYHYTATRLAPNPSAFGERLRDRHSFELTGLTANESAIVETAIQAEDGYVVRENESVTASVSTLLERFPPERVLERYNQPPTGRYVVRYDGSVYLTRLYLQRGFLTREGQVRAPEGSNGSL